MLTTIQRTMESSSKIYLIATLSLVISACASTNKQNDYKSPHELEQEKQEEKKAKQAKEKLEQAIAKEQARQQAKKKKEQEEKKRKQQEKQQKLAKEKAEKERQEKLKAEQARITKAKAEKQRLAAIKAQKEQEAKEKAVKAKLEKEKALQAKLDADKAKLEAEKAQAAAKQAEQQQLEQDKKIIEAETQAQALANKQPQSDSVKVSLDDLPIQLGQWRLSESALVTNTCHLTSFHKVMDDGQGGTDVHLQITAQDIFIKTKSNIDTSYKDAGVFIDGQLVAPVTNLTSETTVSLQKQYKSLIQQLSNTNDIEIKMGFWPSWPVTQAYPVQFSMENFAYAYQHLIKCNQVFKTLK